MEWTNEKKPEEPFLKIGAIWSESEENFEKNAIKEEIVSNIEFESTEPHRENSKNDGVEPKADVFKIDYRVQNPCIHCPIPPPPLPTTKKVVKNINHKTVNADTEITTSIKSMCRHDPKFFTVVKRRLRCGSCKALVCPECCKVMVSTLQNHLLGSDVIDCSLYCCKICPNAFLSVCALQAHIRIHSMDTPYVCPDCGLMYNNVYFLILHLINKCFHVYKIVRYKCKSCSSAYFTLDLYLQHIKEVHIDFVFRCSYCSSLFLSSEEFYEHMKFSHRKLKAQYLNYFRCCLCSNMVIPRPMYQKHLEQHRNSLESYGVEYQCVCGRIYNFIGAFRSHFQICGKKGMLPQNWLFLQKKLKNQEVTQTAPTSETSEKTRQKEESNKVVCSFSNKSTDGGKNEGQEGEAKTNDTIESIVDISIHSKVEELKSNQTQGIWVEEEYSKEINGEGLMVVQENDDGGKINEREETDGVNNCKFFYDHIPRDHLGYVKTQESTKKETSGEMTEKRMSPTEGKSYHVFTELDEKTGLITSRKVPGESLEEEETIMEEQVPKMCTSDKIKLKSNNSFFSCPFCIVIFAKHNSTFQQFRLHLECHHPDAALNITLSDGEGGGKSKSQCDVGDGEGQDDTTNKLEKNGLGLKKKVNWVKKRREETNLENKEHWSENVNKEDVSDHEEATNKMDEEKERVPLNKEEKEKAEESDKNLKNFSPKGKGVYRTVKLSLQKGVAFDKENSNEKCDVTEYKEVDLKKEGGTVEGKVEDTSTTSESFKSDGGVDKLEREFKVTIEKPKMEGDGVLKKNGDNTARENESEKKKPKMRKMSSSNAASDLEDGCDNSKALTWSPLSDMETTPLREQKMLPASEEPLPKSKERSRRESEVWSEFYETLKVAEKLKKKPLESKKSLLLDYSAKRIVKKPKRYIQSSESDESENSESENDDCLGSDLRNSPQEENGDREEDVYDKKKELLSKLENVDHRLVDYLVDLINEKEKSLQLYKKHSSLRVAIRDSQGLRSYRKKVLNGIKHHGRSFEMLRYKELVKTQEDKKRDPPHDGKSSDRKRGRPKKFMESGALQERRRSDKEVDFIEKNFEREENPKEESSLRKRKRKLSSKLQYYKKLSLSDEKDDFSSGQVITTKSTAESNKKFSCAVCKEVFSDSMDFREHIVVHRMEENAYQCMECGECFVVRPSLEKHLHAFHKIKNTDMYITENQCTSIKEVMETNSEPLKENQCKVCRDQFDRPVDLTKHFRIHGMAFLKEFKKEGKTK